MDNILKSHFKDVRIPNNITLPTYILGKFREYGDKVAMVCPTTKETLTYNQIISTTNSLVLGLQSIGLTKGVVVCACLSNCFEYIPLSLAVTSLGAIFATANPDFMVEELIYLFQQCKVAYVFSDATTISKVSEAKGRCPSINKIDSKQDVAFYLGSSGTTGLPKAVQLTHYNVVSILHQLRYNRSGEYVQFATKADEKFCTVFQYCNVAGLICTLLRPLQEGSTCVTFFPKYTSRLMLDAIHTYKVSTIFLAPPVLVYFAKMQNKERYDLSSVKAILCGGAPLSKEVNDENCKIFNLPFITEEYGMTETSSITHMTPVCQKSDEKRGSCGVVVANTLCKVIDINSGEPVGPFKEGEVCVKGPQITPGYLDNVKATKEAIDKDGWLHTGDIGYYDNDEYLFIVDRIKELIKVKGYQVAPAELENIILSHPDVADVAVFGIPDSYSGESLKAHLVLKPNSHATEQEIKQYVSKKVAPYKRLEGGINFVETIPKSPSGKILRRYLKDEAVKTYRTAKL